ncbi:MAG: hypothetical protein RLN85_03685, partial [Pseudomonadales bacterium]
LFSNNNSDDATANNQDFYIGGGYNNGTPTNNSFGGKLAELVIYTAAPSPLQQEQVQSYLAIKYGLTKMSADNGGTGEDERDYFASDSSVIWDYSVNSGFNGVITGIGRDDQGGLNQLQSKNEGSDGVVTMQRSGSFSRDLSYVLWGNNQLSGSSSNVTTAFDARSKRMFFMEVSDSALGDNLNLTIDLDAATIPQTGTASDYRLLINSSSDFSSSIDHTISGGVLVGSDLTFSGIANISDGDYITIGLIKGALQGPADVVGNLQLWLRADSGVTGSTPVSDWADQSGLGFDATATGNSPDLLNSEINFNPVLDFDRANSEYLEITNGILGSGLYDELWIYAVSKADNSSTTNTLLFEDMNGSGQILTALLPWSNDNIYFDFGQNGGIGRINGNWQANYGEANLWTLGTSTALTTPNGTRKAVSKNGEVLFSNNNSDDATANNQDFYIGGGYNNGGPTSNSFGGKLAELVIYTAAPSPLQQEQVQSYLAIKYGLTKVSANNGGTAEDERDYFASDSSVIWDYSVNSGFNGVITGIGRDDEGGLNQLQSKNEGNDGVVTMQRSGSFSRDLSYVLWGNNQLSGISSNVTSAFDGRSRRMIFVDKTDSANGDNLNLTYDLAAGSIPLTGNSADYRLLINGSSDFSSIDHILSGGVLVGNELSFSGISDINDGDYITIGIVVGALEGPGDVVA